MCRRIRESSNFLLFTNPGKPVTLAHYFWGLEKSGEWVLIDVGFPRESLKKRGEEPQDFLGPDQLLANVGADPAGVKKVILTHLHWDHISGLDLFKNATFYLQRREFDFFTGAFVRFPIVKRSVEMEDILKLVRLNYEGRLVLVDGDYPMDDGVDVFFTGGHTPGTQGVRVRGKERAIWITGDITPFYRNFKEEIPPGIYSNLQEILLAYGNIRRMLRPQDDILPGHDPEVTEKFPFDNGIARIL